MLRSMYSGISGMKGMQTKLDTLGNNIANVNTYGYKKGRVTFQDMMSQTVSAAEGPLGDRGGKNPSQVGLGSQVGSIDTIHTQGNRQTTNRTLDLSLEGDGMFILAQGNGITDDDVNIETSNLSFTRAGNFYLDNDGYVVNAEGKYLVGEGALKYDSSNDDYDPTNPSNSRPGRILVPKTAQSFSIQSDGSVKYVDSSGTPQDAGQIRLAMFSNTGGLEKSGANNFKLTENAGLSTDDDGDFDELEDLIVPGQDGAASIVSGSLEMSNVDLAEEFTEMITAQRGFQANTRIITTSDEILQELVNLKR